MNNIIIFILVIIIIGIFVYNFYKESITYNPETITLFPDKKEIERKLTTSRYFEQLNDLDIQARHLNNLDIIPRYIENIESFNQKEKYNLNNVIRNILDNLKSKDKKKFLYSKPWKFAKFSNLENNYPHTHSNIIC